MASTKSTSPVLSQRGQKSNASEDYLLKHLVKTIENNYHAKNKPQGIVNMGTSVNQLCADLIKEKLKKPGVVQFEEDMVDYVDVRGIYNVRKVVSEFMTEKFRASPRLNPDNMIIVNGTTSAMYMLAHCLADPGDVFLSPTPVYGRINSDLLGRSHVELWPIPLTSEVDINDEKPFQLTVRRLELALQAAKEKGKTVKGIILVNPQNPLGDMYPLILLMNILEFCKQHQLHVIFDEIYALSIFRKADGDFHSVLGIPFYPDPKRIHVVWGLSKDFSLASLRVGIIYSFNPEVVEALCRTSAFHTVSSLTQYIMMNFLKDRDWCDRIYFPTNSHRLAIAHDFACGRLRRMGVSVRSCYAGFVLWADFRKFLRPLTFEKEKELSRRLLEARVYIVPGEVLHCNEPGWFRITFALQQDYLETGLKRIEEVLKEIEKEFGQPLCA